MILVTGGTGLVGSQLLLQLAEKGLKISATYRREESILKTKSFFEMYGKTDLLHFINWIPADIIDITALELAFENIDYVYHCAGKISFDPNDEEILRKTNIEGTANIVNFCLAKNIKKLCYVSSVSALGDLSESEIIIDEETDWNPETLHSDYGISKYGGEMEVWRGQQEGLNVVIVNPGIIFGPVPQTWNRREGSFNLITLVINGLKYFTYGTCGFIANRDVATCMITLMESNIENQRFILIEKNYSYQEITSLIASQFKIAAPFKEIKPWMTAILWRLDLLIATVFFKKTRTSKALTTTIHTNYNQSSSKITNEINYKFQSMQAVLEEIQEKY